MKTPIPDYAPTRTTASFHSTFLLILLFLSASGYANNRLNCHSFKHRPLANQYFSALNFAEKNDSNARRTRFISKPNGRFSKRAARPRRIYYTAGKHVKNKSNYIRSMKRGRKITAARIRRITKTAPASASWLFTQLGNAVQMEALHFRINALAPATKKWEEGIDSILQPYLSGAAEYDSILVVGYTDNTGSKKGNLLLSTQRAKNIAAILAEKGIPANRIKIAAVGDDHPVASNSTSSGRNSNRRVEINFLKSS